MTDPLHWRSGGQIPPGVLDPSIARHADTRRSRHDLFASRAGHLADAGARLSRYIERRHVRPLNSIHYDGLAHTRQHDRFTIDHEANLPTVYMVDLDELNRRWWIEFGVKGTTEKAQPDEVETNVKECTPQFFLRNIMRLEHEVGLPVPPYHIEIYFDPDDYERVVTHDFVADYKLPEVDLEEADRVLDDFRRLRHQIFHEADWESIHGNNAWRTPEDEVPIAALAMPKSLKRLRGRFATPEEARKEQEATRKRPRILSDEEFFAMIHNPKLRD